MLIRHKLGKECNIGNIKRTARKNNIPNPWSYINAQVLELVQECKTLYMELMAVSLWLIPHFLSVKLQAALDNGNPEGAKELRALSKAKPSSGTITQSTGRWDRLAPQLQQWSRQWMRKVMWYNTAPKRQWR